MKLKLTKSAFVSFFLFLFVSFHSCKQPSGHTFEIGKQSFLLDGKEFIIRSGEMHFDRIPREYWRHRLQMAKAMGLNTVCTYLFWNKIEPSPDEINHQNLKDMQDFCLMAQEEGLWVILRPGPYVCAEWDMGGLPWWLLKVDDMKVRTRHPYFMERSRQYLNLIGKTMSHLQITKGGPIIMVQVENEYGHYGDDKEYLGEIRRYILEAGFDVPLFQCDYYTRFKDVRDDLFCMANFGSKENPSIAFDSLRRVMPEGPLMVAEYYPGWLDHWGEKHGTVSTDAVLKNLTYFLENKISFNFYMLHGATTFGLWSGANHPESDDGAYQPQTSSYDYDAPISEPGWDTPKYMRIRDKISKYFPHERFPEVPARPSTMTIPEFTLSESATVLDNLHLMFNDSIPRSMEMYDQGFGFIVYSTTIDPESSDSLVFDKVSDFAVVMLDNKPVSTIDRRKKESGCILPTRNKPAKLDILVEAMGRINSDKHIHDRKGIVGKAYLKTGKGKKELTNWLVYPVHLKNESAPANIKYSIQKTPKEPAYYRGKFNATEQKDVFLNMSNWGKGLVWVNGHCLGRFWNIGPTQTMYLPAPWIKEGVNEVVVLDFIGPQEVVINGEQIPILDRN